MCNLIYYTLMVYSRQPLIIKLCPRGRRSGAARTAPVHDVCVYIYIYIYIHTYMSYLFIY